MSNFSCDDEPTGDMYIFYDNIDKYLKYENFCINDNKCDPYGVKCEFKKLPSGEKADIRNTICKRFKYLIYNILRESAEQNSSNEKADGKYLIYWLNREIHKNNANICPKDFLQHMITSDAGNTLLRKMMSYKYYIEYDDVKNMYNLFYIYKSYNDFKKIMDSEYPPEETAMKYIDNCVKKYKELKAKYSEKNTHLSNALNNFKKKYEQTELNKAKNPEWKIENLPSLDGTEDVQEKDTNQGDHIFQHILNLYQVVIIQLRQMKVDQPNYKAKVILVIIHAPL
ncbi:hypothetical protein PVNG_06488 [Plasmodium vivax North Korean]|uniref:Uncharacterized protein n=2 Tax=Plasmodium vivax North Korean TaxID=1035514 RepID=A0A0J9TXX4_PLAVI|nr:hypothetical protein PVNG_06488 [Plasmodium vivax North Korean]